MGNGLATSFGTRASSGFDPHLSDHLAIHASGLQQPTNNKMTKAEEELLTGAAEQLKNYLEDSWVDDIGEKITPAAYGTLAVSLTQNVETLLPRYKVVDCHISSLWEELATWRKICMRIFLPGKSRQLKAQLDAQLILCTRAGQKDWVLVNLMIDVL